jgi:hypothetical protein
MTTPLVEQLRYARSELVRGLNDLPPDDAEAHVGPANSISWAIAHLAWQEQRYWLQRLDGRTLVPELDRDFCFGCPQTTPSLDDAWSMWRQVTDAADPVLDRLTEADLMTQPVVDGRPVGTTIGSLMLRTIYHYWFHLGESMGFRQALGHRRLAQFVGDIDTQAPYRR